MRDLVDRTKNRSLSPADTLLNAALGLVCEAGEVGDLIKKHAFQGHDLDKEKCIEEVGDVLWYLELLLACLDKTREEAEAAVAAKLARRYAKGFTVTESVGRSGE